MKLALKAFHSAGHSARTWEIQSTLTEKRVEKVEKTV